MKKLKQMSGPYSIGFELSSTAHGFVATDPDGNVLYHGKQPVMGTRVFKEGQHAAEARMPRTSRRGIQRRRGREHEMERVFAPVISSIDPDFFIRRRMSYKLGKIRFESDPIGFSYGCFGGMVNQAVVHHARSASSTFFCFGSTANQAVVHRDAARMPRRLRFGGTVNQAVVHRTTAHSVAWSSFGDTVNQAEVHQRYPRNHWLERFGDTVIQVVVHLKSDRSNVKKVSEVP